MSRFDLTGRVAIVTGGSSGIGKAIALALAEEGADVVVTARTQERVDEAVEEIKALGRRSLGVSCDVREADQIAAMVQRAMDTFGKIDILVNNAGGSYGQDFKRGSVLETTEHDLNETLRLNLNSVFLCSKAVAPIMMEQGNGAIVNNASMGGLGPDSTFAAYTAAKAAVISLTGQMAMEWAPSIRVNAVAPGRIDTARSRSRRDPDTLARRISHIAMGRMGAPEEVAGAVVYLASDAASWTTGITIELDGGRNHW
jgi:NAD(P)-dependent dehydrogenase (short-subunit alcohol dehydrogenase family)